VDGDSTDNSQVIANGFNEYFLSVAKKSLSQDTIAAADDDDNNAGVSLIKHKYNSTNNNSFSNIQLKISTTKNIESIIKSLKPKNTCGYDEMSTKFLKINSVYITSPLNHLCNTSLLSGVFPQCLKYSIVKR
jgi:hypothetical protein